MRWTLAALLGSALLAHNALAELTFTVKATRKGVPIPKSEIKLVPFEFGRSRMGHNEAAPVAAHRKTRRTNPTANSANWCGSVNNAPTGKSIKLIHGTFQHPTCTQRSGVTTYPQAAANWVGIDGDTWTSALLQSGTVCKVDNSSGIVRCVFRHPLSSHESTNTCIPDTKPGGNGSPQPPSQSHPCQASSPPLSRSATPIQSV